MRSHLSAAAVSVFVLLALCVSGACGRAHANPLKGMQRLFKDWGLFQGVQISGQHSLTVQQSMLEGSQYAYEGQRWDTAPVIRTSSLSLEGPIWKEFAFKADLSSTGYGPSYGRWVVGYVGHDTALYYGDLNIDLSGNQYASFSKPVSGWQLDQRIGRGLARAFYSEERGLTRYQTFRGNNTSGPFFLSYTPVIEGTEAVKINEQVQVFGEDYRLDYDTGQLWFEVEGKPAKIIPDTATVAVSYQSSGFQSSAGKLYGARAEMPLMGDRMRIGATMITQDRGGSGSQRDNVGYQEDIFQGSGSTGPFDINYRPIIANGSQVIYQGKPQVIEQALTVLVDNVEQAEGVDYDSYRQIGRIIFRRSVPATALVVIRYYHDLSTDVTSGTQNVTGLDLVYHFSPKLNLLAEWGQSDGGADGNTGDAYRANLTYNARNLRIVTEYRDTSPTFTYLDAVGFYRHDKGFDTMANWQISEHIDLAARHSDLQSSEGWTFGYGGYSGGYSSLGLRTAQATDDVSGLAINSLRDDLELRFDFPGWPSLAIMRQKMSNRGGTSGDNSYATTGYQLNYAPTSKPFSIQFGLYDADQLFSPAEGTSGSERTGTKTRQMQWSANYKPGSRLSLSLSGGRNTSDALGATNSSSSNTSQFLVRWTPSDKIDVSWDRSTTESLGNISSGYYNGGVYGMSAAGVWTALNPGGGDSDGDGEDETNRYEDNGSRFSLSYRPSSKVNLDLSLTKRRYTSGGSVGYLADSDQVTRSLSAIWQVNQKLSLNATLGNDRMTFLEEGRGEVANNIMTIGANYRLPDSPWGVALSYNKQDGTSPTYSGFGSSQKMRIVANNLSDLRGQITYSLSRDSELVLSAEASKYDGGYANFNKRQVDINYRRRVGRLADVTLGYRYIRNLSDGNDDPRYGNTSLTPASQNYIANNFMVTLSTQFSSSLGSSGGQYPGPGSYGPTSLSNFGGYRAGPGLDTAYSSSGLGTGYGTFEQMRVFNRQGAYDSTFNNPFGSFGGSGSSSYGGSRYGQYGMGGSYGGYGRPQGYSTFGSNFGGPSSGMGSFAGSRQLQQPGGLDDYFGPVEPGPGGADMPPDERPGDPGQPGELPGGDYSARDEWQALDDLRSVWW